MGGEACELQVFPTFELSDENNLACVKGEMLCHMTHGLEPGDAVALDGKPAEEVRLADVGKDLIGFLDGLSQSAQKRAARNRTAFRELAVPVAPADTIEALRADADEIVCLSAPVFFGAIGFFYADFHQVGDEEVIDLLRRARAPAPGIGTAKAAGSP